MEDVLAPLVLPIASYIGWPTPFTLRALISFFTSFGICLVILLTARWHHHLSADHFDEVQKIHSGQIPRIGGLAIVGALLIAGSHLIVVSTNLGLIFLLGVAALPAFLFGVLEDFTRNVSVRARFLATLLSGFLGCYVLDSTLSSVGFSLIDQMLSYALIALVFTAIASAGLATSINMIDGLNGLSGFIAMAILIGLANLASQAGDIVVYKAAILGACAIAGFVILNWPFGKIFLGDGGAYFIGFFIAWIAILIRSRDAGISAFAMLLICAYPIIETLFSMARRTRLKILVGSPDQKHLHHLIFYHVKYSFHVPLKRANSVAGLLTSLIALPPIWLAVQYPGDKSLLIILFVMYTLLYLLLYVTLMLWAKEVSAARYAPTASYSMDGQKAA